MEYFHPERTELIGESGYIETLCGIRERLAPYLLTERFASFDGTELSWEGYLAEMPAVRWSSFTALRNSRGNIWRWRGIF